jgi:cutinase
MSPHRRRSPRAASTRSAGRWVGLGASALFVGTVLLVTPSAVPVASATDCPDAEVTFARGTDEPPGVGRVGQALVDSLRKQTGMNVGVYAVNYKASLLQLHTDDGSNDAVSHIKSMADKCPNTPQVLGGYSQGASVVDIVTGDAVGGILRGTTLPAQYANMIAAVVTFGNVADRSGAPITTQSPLFGSKAIDLCNPNDPICHAGPGNEWSGHTEGYIPVYTTQAAAFVASQLLAGSGQTVPGYDPPQGFGPQPGYGPQTPGYDPPQGYGPQPGPQTPGYDPQQGYGPQPGYGPQAPGYDPSINGPASPSPVLGLVSAVH